MTITLRAVKGSALTHTEMDDNFEVLKAIAPATSYGATGDGATDDTAALNTWIDDASFRFLPNGDYLMSGSADTPAHPIVIVSDNAEEGGTEIPLLSVSRLDLKQQPKNYFFVRQSSTDRSDGTTAQIQRLVTSDLGHTNPKGLRVWTEKNHSNDSTEWAISGELDSYSTIASDGDTAVSGVSNKYGTAGVFAGHFQAAEQTKVAAATDVTQLVGVEMNIKAIGLDHASANHSIGYRRVLDIIPRTNEGVSGWDTATGNYGAAEIGAGILVRTDDLTEGYFRYGIAIHDQDTTNAISRGLYIHTKGGYSIELAGNTTGAQIQISGNSGNGIVLAGDYTGAAIRIPSGEYIAMEATGSIKMTYGLSATTIWGFYSGANERVGLQMSGTGTGVRVAGVKVIGAQDTGWSAMTGSTNKATVYDTSTVTTAQLAGRVMALQAALTTHGLLGA